MIFWLFLLIILEIFTLISLYCHYHFDEITMLIYSIILVSIVLVYRAINLPGSGRIKKLEEQVRKLLAENDGLKEKLTNNEGNETSMPETQSKGE